MDHLLSFVCFCVCETMVCACFFNGFSGIFCSYVLRHCSLARFFFCFCHFHMTWNIFLSQGHVNLVDIILRALQSVLHCTFTLQPFLYVILYSLSRCSNQAWHGRLVGVSCNNMIPLRRHRIKISSVILARNAEILPCELKLAVHPKIKNEYFSSDLVCYLFS